MRAAVDDSTRRIPISRCSVPTYWCSIDSASCAAYARIFFDSSDSGNSADDEMRSTNSRSPSTSRRICSGLTLKRLKISLMISSPSRRTPRRMCSDSMTREPSLEASYRAKKRARRAFSLYFSNMTVDLVYRWWCNLRRPGLHFEHAVTTRCQFRIMRHDHGCESAFGMAGAHQVENTLARLQIEIARRLVGEKEEGIGQKRSGDGHALLLTAGKLVRKMLRARRQSPLRQQVGGPLHRDAA